MNEIVKKLDNLGTKIESAKKTINQLEGRKEELLNRLKKEFEVSDIEEAKKLLEEFKEYEKELSALIEKEFNKLQEDVKW